LEQFCRLERQSGKGHGLFASNTDQLVVQFPGVVSRGNERIFADQFDQKMGQAQTKFIARHQARRLDGLTIEIRPMPRAKVANNQVATLLRQLAVPPAEPTIVNAERDIHSAAYNGGELIEHNFPRRGQRVLADKTKFHGNLAGRNRAGNEAPSLRRLVSMKVGRGEKPVLVIVSAAARVSMDTPGNGEDMPREPLIRALEGAA